MNEYIYLRFSHSDKVVAEKLARTLEEAGHKVWLGQGSEGDDDRQLRQAQFAIERSDAFILGLSVDLLAEAGADQELKLAQAAEKPIFLAQFSPASLPPKWEAALAERPVADFSDDFDVGLAALMAALAGRDIAADEDDQAGNFFGGDYVGRVPALPGEEIVWSEFGLYWFKKWRTLVRVLVTLTGRRLLFFWDSRDIWKWKPREADELEAAFPLIISLDQITAVGEINKPKSFLIFATGRPYVEFMVGDQLHRFSLETQFESHIETLREAATG